MRSETKRDRERERERAKKEGKKAVHKYLCSAHTGSEASPSCIDIIHGYRSNAPETRFFPAIRLSPRHQIGKARGDARTRRQEDADRFVQPVAKAINIDPTCPPSIERGVQRWRLPFARAGCGGPTSENRKKRKRPNRNEKRTRHGTGRQKSARDTLETRARPDRIALPFLPIQRKRHFVSFFSFLAFSSGCQ